MELLKLDLLRALESRARGRFGMRPRWVETRLLGHGLVVREGTLRPRADYDDAWLCACIQHATVVFDVGANVGQASLMALVHAGVRHTVLVEPNWEALAVAADNLIRNHLSARARFVGAFASDVAGDVVDLWTVGTGAAGSMFQGHAVTAGRAGAVQRVPTMTLDQISADTGLHPDFVKLDVEGAESKALAGAVRIAAKGNTRFLVEMHSPPELPMAENARIVLQWAQRAGYAAWYLTDGSRLESPEPIRHRGRCHLLLQPATWPYPAWLAGIAQSAPLTEHTP